MTFCRVKVPSGSIHDATDFTLPNKSLFYSKSFWMQFLHPSNCFSDGKYWPYVQPSHLETMRLIAFRRILETYRKHISNELVVWHLWWKTAASLRQYLPLQSETISLPLKSSSTLQLFKREHFRSTLSRNYQLTTIQGTEIFTVRM